MVFKRKKDKKPGPSGPATMRSRDTVTTDRRSAAGSAQNPLARRFLEADEPDTVDLEEPVRFSETGDPEQEESTTRLLSTGAADSGTGEETLPEDPVTGAAHCTLTPFWAKRLGKKRLEARQISARGGALSVEDCGDRVHIGGRAVLVMRGEILL